MNNPILKKVVFGFVLVISLISGILVFQTVDIKPNTVSQDEFSAERAFQHVQNISTYPHPIGSNEIVLVRNYIISEIENLGLSPQFQNTKAPDYFRINNDEPVDILNIFVTIPGSNPTGSIVLAGHYDTVPISPGANDNSAAVATLLETAKCLINSQTLQNDVIILFTDAEEPGQFRWGARYFIENFDSIDDIRLVLNFEALGNTGPSIMFETGPGNDWLIEGLASGTSNPVAFSFMSDLYRLIAKGGTDFVAFEETGINGLNFAYSFSRTGYHTALDNIESLDQSSLQHHGEYALDLTRYFGNINLEQESSGIGESTDYVYQSVSGMNIVKYPTSWTVPLAFLSGLLLILLMIIAFKKTLVTIGGLLLGFLVFLAEVFGITILLTLGWWGIDALHLAFGTVVEPTFKAHLLFVGFLVLTMVMMLLIRIWFFKRIGFLGFTLGAIILWWLLTLLASLYLPGFSLLFVWPLLGSLLPLSWILFKNTDTAKSWGYVLLISISSLIAIILFTAPIYLLFQAIGTASPGFSGSPAFPIIGLPIFFWVLLLGLLLPHLQFITNFNQKNIVVALAAFTVICLLVGFAIPGINLEDFGLQI